MIYQHWDKKQNRNVSVWFNLSSRSYSVNTKWANSTRRLRVIPNVQDFGNIVHCTTFWYNLSFEHFRLMSLLSSTMLTTLISWSDSKPQKNCTLVTPWKVQMTQKNKVLKISKRLMTLMTNVVNFIDNVST